MVMMLALFELSSFFRLDRQTSFVAALIGTALLVFSATSVPSMALNAHSLFTDGSAAGSAALTRIGTKVRAPCAFSAFAHAILTSIATKLLGFAAGIFLTRRTLLVLFRAFTLFLLVGHRGRTGLNHKWCARERDKGWYRRCSGNGL